MPLHCTLSFHNTYNVRCYRVLKFLRLLPNRTEALCSFFCCIRMNIKHSFPVEVASSHWMCALYNSSSFSIFCLSLIFILLNFRTLLNSDGESRIETAASHLWWIKAASLHATVIRQHCWCYFLAGVVRVAVCWVHLYRHVKHSASMWLFSTRDHVAHERTSVSLVVNNRCVHLMPEGSVRR